MEALPQWPRRPSQDFIYGKLLSAYKLCLKTKPAIKSSSWHWHHEGELRKLSWLLHNNRYRPEKSSLFVVTEPKPREIVASHIRDRVVHRMIFEYMSPYWERRFLAGSYACRKGKGPLKAVFDLERFLRGYEGHFPSRPLFALKADVSRFFPSLNHAVLESQILSHMENPFFRSLVTTVIRHRATESGNYVRKSPVSQWAQVEAAKSLFNAPQGQGLPIGNLTSQFFANIHMHDCDVWLARQCREIRDEEGRRVFLYWQRYVDDILVLGPEPKALLALLNSLDEFLLSQLKLKLNPKKSSLRPVRHGVDHLGHYVKPRFSTVRRSVRLRACKRMRSGESDKDLALAQLQSSLSFAKHGRNFGLRKLYASVFGQEMAKSGRLLFSKGFEKVRPPEVVTETAWIDDLWSSASFQSEGSERG